MEASQASFDVLAHFERDPVPSWCAPISPLEQRGVMWVLKWFAALATLVFASTLLLSFVYCLAAERALARAARAGALEATLPRATLETISQTVEKRLHPLVNRPHSGLRIEVQHNGRRFGGPVQLGDGDKIAVAVSAPASAMLPGWLARACFWQRDERLTVRAERSMPGRRVRKF